ncbi:glycosyltransferase family 2 protein [Selenomonas ruminantium]|uniref:Glycosyltransferase involved in cell wall bisynthesis n=1 Tax=Selenomonas ruminantium TaxID=971 RepID=A0A1H0M711_SELRU|nr:glycosyltransferase family 2 protein [Selenomonas ruminantium]SDO76259.1 Glycosyltransferase involved in cell wall bisynthesis [Selenomonas ruminantium]
MYQPKISIITVVYNRENKIEQLLASVVEQTYKNIEFIVVDGGSTDGTVEKIRKYEYGISKWISEPDTGIYNAFNKGWKMASGDYVEYIGSDDALAGKDAIAKIIHHFSDMPDILSCNEYLVYPKVGRQKVFSNRDARNKETYQGGMVGHAAMFVRRQLLEKYPFDENYKIVSDYKFFLQCYFDENVRIKYVDDIVAFFEADAGGLSSDITACWDEDERVYRELNLNFNDCRRSELARPLYKRVLVGITDVFGVTDKIRKWKNYYISCKKHTCTNRICRWCGRGEGRLK